MRAFTNYALRLALIATSALIVPQAVLQAQRRDTTAVAKIPFAFQVGSDHYPAGTYTVRLQNECILTITSTTHSGIMQVNWDSSNRPSAAGELVFHRYGTQYFLRQMRIPGSSEYLASPQSKAERSAQREMLIADRNAADGPSGSVQVGIEALVQ